MYYQRNNNVKLRNIKHEYIPANPPDFILKIVVIFLTVIGLMSVFSASVPKCINMGVSPLHFTYIQLAGIILGYFLLRILSNLDYKKLAGMTNGFAVFVIALLVIVHCTGDIINGAQRWISIGPVNIQPSELAKPAIVMLLAKVFSKDADLTDSGKWSTFLLILIMVFFIFKQPNISMVMLLGIT
jgi:cell division protein FtsW